MEDGGIFMPLLGFNPKNSCKVQQKCIAMVLGMQNHMGVPMPDRRPALTIKEIQTALGGASRAKVHQLLRSGELPSIKLGPKMRRVLPQDLDDFLARLKREDVERRKAASERRKAVIERRAV